MDLKKKVNRFIFLILISNGYFIWIIFLVNHFKFLVYLILLLIIRRELQYRSKSKEKNRKYYVLNYGLFVFLLGMSPYFVFLLFIYIFKEIELKKLFKKENVEIYFIVFLWFVIQNFTFILYPSQIFEVLKGFDRPGEDIEHSYPFYLNYLIGLKAAQMQVLSYVFVGILITITLVLIHLRKLNIEKKFSFFFLGYLFFGITSNPDLIAHICLSFVLLLFVPLLKQDVVGYEFIHKNKVLLIGVVSFFLINHIYFLKLIFLNWKYNLVFEAFGLITLYTIMLICLFMLYMKKNNFTNKDLNGGVKLLQPYT